MNIYLESFGIFFKIGAFTIGGGYAMVPLIENEIVTKRKWIAQDISCAVSVEVLSRHWGLYCPRLLSF